jgi:hypothetical protein
MGANWSIHWEGGMSVRAMNLAKDELQASRETARGGGPLRGVASLMISMAQAARLLGVSRPTAAAIARARKFRAWLVNARLKTTVEAIEAYLGSVELPDVGPSPGVTLAVVGGGQTTAVRDATRARLSELADLQGLK